MGRNIRAILSRDGRKYKDAVALACRQQNAPNGLSGRILTHILLNPPDKRCRDIDNSVKAILVSLTSAEVWLDDSQVDKLVVERGTIVPGGSAHVLIGGLA